MKMKKQLAGLLAAVMLLGSASGAFAAGFDATLEVERSGDKIIVTVPDNEIYGEMHTSVTIPCDGEWKWASVVYGGETAVAEVKDGEVTFTVTGGGAYVITLLTEKPEEPENPGEPDDGGNTGGDQDNDDDRDDDDDDIDRPSRPNKGDKDDSKTDTEDWENPFDDLDEDDWFYDAVEYALENGLMSGMTSEEFAPYVSTTRGMIVSILYRLAGEPPVGYSDFTDVTNSAYYADAVTWAAANSIVSGYGNGKFGPNDPITREQLAAMLWRYAGSPATAIALDGFADADSASNYAMEALTWATQNAVMQGNGNGLLNPRGTATRAHVAQMLMNYFKG